MTLQLGCVWLESHESGAALFQFLEQNGSTTRLVARTEPLHFSVWFMEWERSHNLNRLTPLSVDPTRHWYLE
jgi:hypothetical protein